MFAAERMPFRFNETKRNTVGPSQTSTPDRHAGARLREFSVEAGVLRFGEFKTKAGRLSPYFFNAGLFDDGAKLGRLAQFYARRLIDSGLRFDMLFRTRLQGDHAGRRGRDRAGAARPNKPFAYNRKETKNHGEGGVLVGAPVAGRVLIIDDVISAGTSVRESIEIIRAAGGTPCGVAIALDRQEKATEAGAEAERVGRSFVEQQLALTVVAVATLSDLWSICNRRATRTCATFRARCRDYRERYGA